MLKIHSLQHSKRPMVRLDPEEDLRSASAALQFEATTPDSVVR